MQALLFLLAPCLASGLACDLMRMMFDLARMLATVLECSFFHVEICHTGFPIC